MRVANVSRSSDWVLLAGCVALVVVSSVISVNHGKVTLDPEGELQLPTVCGFKRLTGMDCPSCGLTRSFVAMAHLDPGAAWSFHRLGPFAFTFVLLQIPYRVLRLASATFARRTDHGDFPANVGVLLVLFVLLVANWIFNLVA